MSLYDVVHAPQPRERDRKLHILIAIGLILVLAAFIPIPWAMHLQRQYRHFINGLGESVQYAKEQGGLYVRRDGRLLFLSGKTPSPRMSKPHLTLGAGILYNKLI